MDTAVSVELFVEILNRYVYYFEQGNETVTTKYLNGLIELVHSNLSSTSNNNNNTAANIAGNGDTMQPAAGGALENPKRHFYRTLDYIREREWEGVVTEARN